MCPTDFLLQDIIRLVWDNSQSPWCYFYEAIKRHIEMFGCSCILLNTTLLYTASIWARGGGETCKKDKRKKSFFFFFCCLTSWSICYFQKQPQKGYWGSCGYKCRTKWNLAGPFGSICNTVRVPNWQLLAHGPPFEKKWQQRPLYKEGWLLAIIYKFPRESFYFGGSRVP